MNRTQEKYRLLEDDSTLGDQDTYPVSTPATVWFAKDHTKSLLGLLTLSCILNLVLVIQVFRPQTNDTEYRSKYGGLTHDLPIPFEQQTPYNAGNFTLADQAWKELDTDIDNGVVALTDDWIGAKQLPVAQRFPWDDNKGIYLLNGAHNLHCLKQIRVSALEFHRGQKQSRPFNHITHCIDALRQDIICNADDTPRYTAASLDRMSGVGQYRQCRDWSKLQAWAKNHTACYQFIHETDNDVRNIERFKFCPAGSPYIAEVEAYFGDPSNV